MALNRILVFDALTCAAMGIALMFLAQALSPLLGLPQNLLFYAGCLLIPIAIFMAILARQAVPATVGTRLVIVGNVAWIAASLAVLGTAGPSRLGAGFLIVQVVIVALLTLAEFNAASRHPSGIAWESAT